MAKFYTVTESRARDAPDRSGLSGPGAPFAFGARDCRK